ncbi:MAG: hypothetical protein HWN67_08220 [Candidatus Helarchaeota archaeon]|nr:hypothetical protein [Candidatus Helarchaeota archaeon]
MEEFKEEFLQIQKKMKDFDKEYKKKLLFLAFINKFMNKVNSNIIILGGFAVQFYTAGEYLTKDVDLACNNIDVLNDLLISLKFEKIGRHYYSNELDIAIEVPTSSITRNEKERLTIIEIEGYEVPILGVEDIIIDRLNAFAHWKSLEDGRLAKELVLIHFNKIDWKYLKMRAEDERVSSELNEIKVEMQKEREKYENKL